MKAKKVSVIARGKYARAAVWKGRKAKTVGGLTKDTLIKSKSGKIVSKAASARGKKAFATSALKKWGAATLQARKALGITGFCPVGGQDGAGESAVSQDQGNPWQVRQFPFLYSTSARSLVIFHCP